MRPLQASKVARQYRTPHWTTLVVTACVALLVSVTLAFSRPINMVVDGQRVLSDVPPVTVVGDKVYVPLRALSEGLGAQMNYDVSSGRIDVVRGDKTLRLKVGETKATLNGAPMTLKHAPFRVRGRVMLNVKAIARAFNVRVSYNRRTARLEVDTPGVVEAGAQEDAP